MLPVTLCRGADFGRYLNSCVFLPVSLTKWVGGFLFYFVCCGLGVLDCYGGGGERVFVVGGFFVCLFLGSFLLLHHGQEGCSK